MMFARLLKRRQALSQQVVPPHSGGHQNGQSQYLMSPSQPHVATLLVSSGCHSHPMQGVLSCAGIVFTMRPGLPQSQTKSLPCASPLMMNLPSGEKPTCGAHGRRSGPECVGFCACS